MAVFFSFVCPCVCVLLLLVVLLFRCLLPFRVNLRECVCADCGGAILSLRTTKHFLFHIFACLPARLALSSSPSSSSTFPSIRFLSTSTPKFIQRKRVNCNLLRFIFYSLQAVVCRFIHFYFFTCATFFSLPPLYCLHSFVCYILHLRSIRTLFFRCFMSVDKEGRKWFFSFGV